MSCLRSVLLILWALGVVSAQAPPPGEDFFAQKLYPIMEEAQCRLCHSSTGVAATTRLDIPRPDATSEEIQAFGLSLRELIDPDDPEKSLLLNKPTLRIPHTGGERIPQDSEKEKILREWVFRLTTINEEQQRAASETKRTLETKLGVRPAVMRRLTHAQYNNTVHDLLGDLTRPANQFPSEDFVNGFKNQGDSQSIPPLLAEAYGKAAESLARDAFRAGDLHQLIPCETTDPGCQPEFVRHFGLRAFRRPLTDAEIANYVRLFKLADNFLGGAQIVVEAMLQSPNFLYRTEQGPGGRWYGYEVASRLSYFLWNTMPDEKLLARAGGGSLESPEQVEEVTREMLEDPRSRDAMEEFLAQWLRFDRVWTAVRDRREYRLFNSDLARAMTEETSRLFHHLVWEDKSFMEFFTADYAFLSADLADLYKLPAPDEDFGRVEFPEDSGRAGVLGQATFHTLTSKPAETSPTERGLFVREHFLCQKVPPPPPGVNTTLPAVTDERPLTNRERLTIHLTSPACAGCHQLVDPVGFGFEQYDAVGRFRKVLHLEIHPTRDEQRSGRKKKATEYDLTLDTSGRVAGISDSNFQSPKELGAILAREPQCQQCVVTQLFRYAFGRSETPADRPVIERAWEDFRDSGYRFRELIVSLVTSPAFLKGVS